MSIGVGIEILAVTVALGLAVLLIAAGIDARKAIKSERRWE